MIRVDDFHTFYRTGVSIRGRSAAILRRPNHTGTQRRRPPAAPSTLRSVILAALMPFVFSAIPTDFASARETVHLGDAPVFSSDTWFVDSDKASVTSGVPAVNTRSRSESVAYFNNYYRDQEMPAIEWSGNRASCDAGTTSDAFRDDVLSRIMYFRGMAGVPTAIGLSSSLNSKSQQAAVLMSANSALSHFPPSEWRCWTPEGGEAAGSSNLALGTFGRLAIDAYMDDFGNNNSSVGHRRWLLYPQTRTFATGDTPSVSNGEGGQSYWRSNALWVFDSNIGGPRPATRDGYVAWPPPGHVPYQVVYRRWSFSFPGADFANAGVTLTRSGVNVPVTVESRADNGYGENTIVFHQTGMADFHVWENPGEDDNYQVAITNVGNASSATFVYDVVVIDPDRLGNPAVGPTRNYTGAWYQPSEGGWGLLLHQYPHELFAAWFTYDRQGRNAWYQLYPDWTGEDVATGSVRRPSGPTWGPSFDPAQVTFADAGSFTLTFVSDRQATFTFNVDGLQRTVALYRLGD